jgi:two-component system sensor histidine kinase KdpD
MTTGAGRLRIYLGIAPGVGKTYAMLRDGRSAQRAGVDTVLAYLERHGRPETSAQRGDLEKIPRRTVAYRGGSFPELDVAAVLDRKPALALVDELAHANLPGEHHEKRWQDVAELLAHGIDVSTTLNIANVESLGPLVAQITGVTVAEPVPDEFLRGSVAHGGKIELIDLAPAALRHRLAEGKVVPAEQADAALSSYFRFANLADLRELALLWIDDEVQDPVRAYHAARGISVTLQAAVIVAGLAGTASDEWVIRYAAQLAGLSHAALRGVHVRPIDNLDRPAQRWLAKDRELLSELQGTFAEVRSADIAAGLVQAARAAGACEVVVGTRRRSRLSRLLAGRTLADQVLTAADGLPVQVVNVGSPQPGESNRERSVVVLLAHASPPHELQELQPRPIRPPPWNPGTGSESAARTPFSPRRSAISSSAPRTDSGTSTPWKPRSPGHGQPPTR